MTEKSELAVLGCVNNVPVGRDQIMRLEQAIRELPNQLDCDSMTSHHFASGMYLRELRLPAGSVVTGKIHRTQHLTIICHGTVRITTEEGVREITGPAVFISEPGAKKAVFTLTDAVIMNPMPTTLTDLDQIEETFIAPSFEALEQEKKPCLSQQ